MPKGGKIKNLKPNLRRLGKADVFYILDSGKSGSILAKKFGVTRDAINKIKSGKRYKDWHQEYISSNRGLIESQLETLPFLRSLSAYYWLDNGGNLRIAFDDLLIKINLANKSLVSLDFNVDESKGQRLEYDEALQKLDEHGFLKL